MKNLSYFVRLCALNLTFVTSSITFAAGADVNEENTLQLGAVAIIDIDFCLIFFEFLDVDNHYL